MNPPTFSRCTARVGGRAAPSAWLRIVHCDIFHILTVSEAVVPGAAPVFGGAAVVEALERPRNLMVSPSNPRRLETSAPSLS